ncbi:hypothetical protein [Undibacterium sp.]|uniref:hypothetical protein n=1 Tax=Undibacterium sp. TaxID=1914977 RepID=UPI00272F0AF2|nr:hypothetical protein [Undibacterium sp.]MDP1978031.1 hypothetical protein [Undibacterium sp.]
MSRIPTLAELAALEGDRELSLPKPLEFDTYNEVLHMMNLLNRAGAAIAASKRSLEARKVPFDSAPFRAAEDALNDCFSAIAPLPLAHALAQSRGVAQK